LHAIIVPNVQVPNMTRVTDSNLSSSTQKWSLARVRSAWRALFRFLEGGRIPSPSKARKRGCRPCVELLEDRWLPANYTYTQIAEVTPFTASWSNAKPAINDSGQIAVADFNASGQAFILRGSGGTPTRTPVANVTQVAINNSGLVAYSGKTQEFPTYTNGVFTLSGNTTALIAGNNSSQQFLNFYEVDVNDSGRVAFYASAFTPAFQGRAIFTALNGDAPNNPTVAVDLNSYFDSGAPGGGGGLNPNGRVFINSAGSLAFSLSSSIQNNSGIYVADASGVEQVVNSSPPNLYAEGFNDAGTIAYQRRFGDVVTQTSDGQTHLIFAAASVNDLRGISLNNSGQVAFGLESGFSPLFQVPGARSIALASLGGPTKIIQDGDSLLGSSVSEVYYRNFALNDNGQVAFYAKLADGRTVLVRADPQQVVAADLAITMTGSKSLVTTNDVFTYSLHTVNNGPEAAHGVTVTATLPDDFTALPILDGSVTLSGNTITWTIGSLASGANVDLSIPGLIAATPGANQSQTLTALASVTNDATTTDPNLDDNTARVDTQVVGKVDASDVQVNYTTSFGNNKIGTGQRVSFAVTIRNNASIPLVNLVETFMLPSGFTNVSVVTEDGIATVSGTTVTFRLNRLIAHTAISFGILTTAPLTQVSGIIPNSISADNYTLVNSPPLHFETFAPDIGFSITPELQTVYAGQRVTFTVSVRNDPEAAPTVDLTVGLGILQTMGFSSVQVTNKPAGATTEIHSSGVVCNLGELGPDEETSFTVTATAPFAAGAINVPCVVSGVNVETRNATPATLTVLATPQVDIDVTPYGFDGDDRQRFAIALFASTGLKASVLSIADLTLLFSATDSTHTLSYMVATEGSFAIDSEGIHVLYGPDLPIRAELPRRPTIYVRIPGLNNGSINSTTTVQYTVQVFINDLAAGSANGSHRFSLHQKSIEATFEQPGTPPRQITGQFQGDTVAFKANGQTVGTGTVDTLGNVSGTANFAARAVSFFGTVALDPGTGAFSMNGVWFDAGEEIPTGTFNAIALDAPTVTSISPAAGPAIGGTQVTIQGTNFGGMGLATVEFGEGNFATILSNDGSTIVAVVPVGVADTVVDISVRTASGASAASPSSQFTFTSTVSTTTGVAAHANVLFSSGNQTVTLSATVTPGNSAAGGVVNEGAVTFTVVDARNQQIGVSVTSATVVANHASVNFTLPGNTSLGTYFIHAVYNPKSVAPSFATSSDLTNGHVLSVTRSTTTKVTSTGLTRTFSTGNQNVILTATVATAVGKVNEGTVAFTLLNASNQQVGGVITSNQVAAGVASATLNLAGLPVGSYRIHAVYVPKEIAPGFHTSVAATDGTLAVTKDATKTTVTSTGLNRVFSTGSQLVQLTATIGVGNVAASGTVNEGTVTFTVLNSAGATVATLGGNPVVNGAAGVAYDLARLPAGAHRIRAVYVPRTTSPNFNTSTSVAFGTLNVAKDSAVTTVTSTTLHKTFSTGAQPVPLTATVNLGNAAAGGEVNEGSVTFTILNASNRVVATFAKNPVVHGNATITYNVANLPAGAYRIHAVYVPKAAGAGFTTSASTPDGTLTIDRDSTNTAVAADAVVVSSTVSRAVILRATVTPGNGPEAGVVNEGTVTFRVFDAANQQLGASVTSTTVVANNASASFMLPANAAVGTYFIRATYNPKAASPSFTTSADNSNAHTLSVKQNTTTTVTSTGLSRTFSTGSQNVNLTAAVKAGTNPVNEGTVTFTFLSSTNVVLATLAGVPVTNGSAAASVDLAGRPVGAYRIRAVYVPNATNAKFNASVSAINGTLAIVKERTVTAVMSSPLTRTFTTGPQMVQLTAAVNPSLMLGGGEVNEGTVTFTILGAGNLVKARSTGNAVAHGVASATLNLAGLKVGTYRIHAVYVPKIAAPGFLTSADTNDGTLTITPV
jgi:uncharacterized repeat protein (TIGR01451 family)